MWFEALTGFREEDVDDVAAVQSRFVVDGEWITSTVNGRRMRAGLFEAVSLEQLRQRLSAAPHREGRLRVREVVADAQGLHADPANADALFQVASQFNTLEMAFPTITPEQGIDRYESDRTQRPACAVACGAGTMYRNYLVPLASQPDAGNEPSQAARTSQPAQIPRSSAPLEPSPAMISTLPS